MRKRVIALLLSVAGLMAFSPAAISQAKEGKVTVTLVRWPYT
jgi:ABC-type glycerol-3-phosphate transport system substrate-binding protein